MKIKFTLSLSAKTVRAFDEVEGCGNAKELTDRLVEHLREFIDEPEKVFGMKAITGMDDDHMAKTIYRLRPDPNFVLSGENISQWPTYIDPRWVARRKTW